MKSSSHRTKTGPSIAVHGGAGTRTSDSDAPALQAASLEAARKGMAVLERGGGALDAVVAAVMHLENVPLFNAGVGSALNARAEVEMDAAVMQGSGLMAGAVAAVRTVKNAVWLAREVMDHSPHVLLVGDGAEEFATARGLERVDPKSLITEMALRRWEEARGVQGANHGTVGAVAVDQAGHVAAATSTGGMVMKWPGRVGDSPLIGCGTYAEDGVGAVSATGHGEFIIRRVLAKSIADRMQQGATPEAAGAEGIEKLGALGGTGGVIVVNHSGDIGFAFNTERMTRAWVLSNGEEGSAYE